MILQTLSARSSTRNRRGMTLLETAVSTAAFSGVALFVTALVVTTGKQTRATISTLPEETSSYRGMETLRRELLAASSNSVLSWQREGDDINSIVFTKPTDPAEKMIYFDEDTKTLMLDEDTSSNGDEVELGQYEDVEFDTKNYGQYVSITIREQGRDSKNKPVILSRQEWIRVRN